MKHAPAAQGLKRLGIGEKARPRTNGAVADLRLSIRGDSLCCCMQDRAGRMECKVLICFLPIVFFFRMIPALSVKKGGDSMHGYSQTRVIKALPRIPLKGRLDLTYRCNNNCRHCWLQVPPDAPEEQEEVTLYEIRQMVDEARAMGTREWAISGGEPMLRPDFNEIFDYITSKATTYSLNTNGTLISPSVAQLTRRNPEEAVLLACKSSGSDASPSSIDVGCMALAPAPEGSPAQCSPCSEYASS